MTKEKQKKYESKLFDYYKEENGPAWHLISVDIDLDQKEVKVVWKHKNPFIGRKKITYTYPLYKLPEEYSDAVNALNVHLESTERTCYDCGVSSTVFCYNEKMFVMVKDGRVVKGNN
jgi:hypothetical protein